YSILQRISSIHNAGGLRSRRQIRFPDEDYISQMRQQLHDALSAFQFGAFLELLSKDSNPRAGSTVADPPKARQSQTPEPSDPPSPEHSYLQGRQATQIAELAQDDRSLHPGPKSQSHTQRAKRQPTPAAADRNSSSETGEIPVAFMHVERCRRSLRHSHSPGRTMELASALGRLSVLLGEAGRTREALEASQESAELYRSLAEGPY
ncbi:hypothetical protein RSAG8_03727, partial [Rhizoctonia solani AG-8 WAC10335]